MADGIANACINLKKSNGKHYCQCQKFVSKSNWSRDRFPEGFFICVLSSKLHGNLASLCTRIPDYCILIMSDNDEYYDGDGLV